MLHNLATSLFRIFGTAAALGSRGCAAGDVPPNLTLGTAQAPEGAAAILYTWAALLWDLVLGADFPPHEERDNEGTEPKDEKEPIARGTEALTSIPI